MKELDFNSEKYLATLNETERTALNSKIDSAVSCIQEYQQKIKIDSAVRCIHEYLLKNKIDSAVRCIQEYKEKMGL